MTGSDTRDRQIGTDSVSRDTTYLQALRQMPVEVTRETAQAVWKLYAPAHMAKGFQASSITRHQPYGPHDRQRLDIHTGPDTPANAPVILFVPGGGFVAGEKHTEGTPYYDHIGAWAANQGMVAVTMNYRLAPRDPWPAGAADVAGAVTWINQHVTDYGGDPSRIVLIGHSAGASHAAGYLAGHAGHAPAVAAAVLLSGVYELSEGRNEAVAEMYYGTDPANFARRQPLPELADTTTPILYGIAEMDPPAIHEQTASALNNHYLKHGVLPALVRLEGHNHISEIVSLGIDDTQLTATLRHFIHTTTQSAPSA